MAKDVYIPQLGQTVEEVQIVRWLAEDGATVTIGQELLEVETDKAVFTVEATATGALQIGAFAAGDVVPVLTVVAVIGTPAAPAFDLAAAPQRETPSARAATPFASPRARRLAAVRGIDLGVLTPTGGGGARIAERDVLGYLAAAKATPLAHNVASAAGVDVRSLSGSGVGGRITRNDVAAAASSRDRAVVDDQRDARPAQTDVLERVPLRGVRGVIAQRMAESARAVARVTLLMEVDATELVAMRARLRAKVYDAWGFAPGYNDLAARIVAHALREFPYMNARITDDAIEHLAAVNIGMAVDTARGLLVPVLRDADRKSLRQLGTEFRTLVERAQAGRATPDDLSGGTFTITNLGMFNVDAFTPIINVPEAAILGLGRIVEKPVMRGGQVVGRHMWTLSLAFDHRVTDGAPAARFLQHIKALVEEPYLLATL